MAADKYVTQERLRLFREVQKRYRQVRTRYEKLESELMADLRKHPVEPGKLDIELVRRGARRVSWKGVLIDLKGEAYAERVLESTERKPFRVLHWLLHGKVR
jgi:hypothetical protein